jgi:hypothetical protein
MTRTLDIPWLYDRHSHVSLYGALEGCPSLACEPEAGMAMLRGLPRDRITTVLGWQSWRLPLGPEDLDALPPALIINFSLHGCNLTTAAKRMLGPEQLDLLESLSQNLLPGQIRHRRPQPKICKYHAVQYFSMVYHGL